MPEELVLPVARHEPNDLGGKFFGWMFAAILVSLALCVLLTWLIYPGRHLDKVVGTMPHTHGPQLQASPRHDMQMFYAEEMRKLHGVYWIDRKKGVVHLPIEDAMRKVAHDGIAGWPAPGGAP